MDEDYRAYMERTLRATLEQARQTGEGYAGAGWLTAAEAGKRARFQRARTVAVLVASPAFRELDPISLHRLGAKHNARLFGLATWDPPSGGI